MQRTNSFIACSNARPRTTRPGRRVRGGQQHRTSVWLRDYNGHRPHESLEQKMPRQFYRKAQRVFPPRLPELRYSKASRKRKVRSNGEVRWAGRKRFIGEAFVRQTIGLRQLQRGIWAVYFAHLLIGHLHDRDLGAMRPVVYKHRFRTVKKSKL